VVKLASGIWKSFVFKIEKIGLEQLTFMAFRWALNNGYDFILKWMLIFLIIRTTWKVIQCLSFWKDLAIGSRYVTGVNVVNWP
jgi:dolichol-phosphate mannosyltransferase